jgi:excisionase family DNA binding protein
MTPAIDPLTLPSVPFAERRLLPEIAAVYFALDAEGAVLYVGQTTRLRSRWATHHRLPQLQAVAGVRLAWCTVDKPDQLLAIEEALIATFAPPLNGAATSLLRKKEEGTSKTPAVQGADGLLSADGPFFMTVEKVAIALGFTPRTIVRYLAQGILPGRKFGSEWRIHKKDFRDFTAPVCAAAGDAVVRPGIVAEEE